MVGHFNTATLHLLSAWFYYFIIYTPCNELRTMPFETKYFAK
jgi:hypothetical protein